MNFQRDAGLNLSLMQLPTQRIEVGHTIG